MKPVLSKVEGPVLSKVEGPVLSKVEGPVLSKVEGSGAGGAVEIFTDGACKGNPGLGGWGALLVWGERNKKICGGEPHTTNNRMELTAVIEALRTLKRPCKVKLHTDSQYVKQGITTWIHDWKRRGWRTTDRKPVKNQDLWQELDRLASGHQIEWIWVKGHAGHDGNEQADALANRGVESVFTK